MGLGGERRGVVFATHPRVCQRRRSAGSQSTGPLCWLGPQQRFPSPLACRPRDYRCGPAPARWPSGALRWALCAVRGLLASALRCTCSRASIHLLVPFGVCLMGSIRSLDMITYLLRTCRGLRANAHASDGVPGRSSPGLGSGPDVAGARGPISRSHDPGQRSGAHGLGISLAGRARTPCPAALPLLQSFGSGPAGIDRHVKRPFVCHRTHSRASACGVLCVWVINDPSAWLGRLIQESTRTDKRVSERPLRRASSRRHQQTQPPEPPALAMGSARLLWMPRHGSRTRGPHVWPNAGCIQVAKLQPLGLAEPRRLVCVPCKSLSLAATVSFIGILNDGKRRQRRRRAKPQFENCMYGEPTAYGVLFPPFPRISSGLITQTWHASENLARPHCPLGISPAPLVMSCLVTRAHGGLKDSCAFIYLHVGM